MPDPSHRSYADRIMSLAELTLGFRDHRRETGLPPFGNHEFRIKPPLGFDRMGFCDSLGEDQVVALNRDGRHLKPRKDSPAEELPEKEGGAK